MTIEVLVTTVKSQHQKTKTFKQSSVTFSSTLCHLVAIQTNEKLCEVRTKKGKQFALFMFETKKNYPKNSFSTSTNITKR